MTHKTLGIIGAENSHSWNIATLCNKLEKVPLRVSHIWGETRELAEAAASRGEIPNIVDDWRELAGQVDAIMIDHRHGKEHVIPASFFIERGLPTFVDKPMACDYEEAKALFTLADKYSVPVLSFSSKPLQKGYQDFAAKLKEAGTVAALNCTGPADIDSEYGGVFFYGIHQVDCALEIMGTAVIKASLVREGANGVACLFFEGGGLATLNLLKNGEGGFHWRACTEKGIFNLDDQYDELPYLTSANILSRFVHEGHIPFSRKRMLAPIAILEALQKSFHSGKPEAVPEYESP